MKAEAIAVRDLSPAWRSYWMPPWRPALWPMRPTRTSQWARRCARRGRDLYRQQY